MIRESSRIHRSRMRLNASAPYTEMEYDPMDTFFNGRLRGGGPAAAGRDGGGLSLGALLLLSGARLMLGLNVK